MRALTLTLSRQAGEGTGRALLLVLALTVASASPSSAKPAITPPIPPRPAQRGEVGAAAPGEGPAAPLTPAAFRQALTDDTDVVVFPAARRPGPRPIVTVATRVHGSPTAVGAVLLDPARYQAALPSLARAAVVSTRPPAAAGDGPDRLLEWELEIPLFNLKGKAWLQRRGDMVELALVEGAFAPGYVRFRVASDNRATTLVTEAQIEARSANWIFRRVARHDPWSETAMTAAAAWVVTRAVALEVEFPHQAGHGYVRPDGPITAPAATALDGAALAGASFGSLRQSGVVAVVRRTPSERLAYVSAAVPVAAAPPPVAERVSTPESWTAFPGWKSIKRLPSVAPELKIAVEDNVAFVDLDATWLVAYGAAARATVVDGAIRGAVLAWQTFPDPAHPTSSLAVLSEHPRLDASGYAARKILAAEPLMEHALALAMTYADAAALADRF